MTGILPFLASLPERARAWLCDEEYAGRWVPGPGAKGRRTPGRAEAVRARRERRARAERARERERSR